MAPFIQTISTAMTHVGRLVDAFSDERLLALLTEKVRVLSDRQLAELKRDSAFPLRSAREAFQRLCKRGLLVTRTAMIHPELSLDAPLLAWSPGDSTPHFERLAWRTRSRWKLAPERTVIAIAAKKARIARGGKLRVRPLRPLELTHDLHVTALYLKFSQESPEKAATWIHEDDRRSSVLPAIIPDAMFAGKAIDFAGRYKAGKLRKMHGHYAVLGQAYELW